MNIKIIGKILAIINILLAVYVFDWSSWNKTIISSLLFLIGISLFLKDSKTEVYRELSKSLHRIAFIISIFFIIKLIFVG